MLREYGLFCFFYEWMQQKVFQQFKSTVAFGGYIESPNLENIVV